MKIKTTKKEEILLKIKNQSMDFFRKTMQSFLSLCYSKDSKTRTKSSSHDHCCHIPPNSGCFCLISGDTHKHPNVVVSNAIKPNSSKKDSISFLFDIGNNEANGSLPSCAESLGFESAYYPIEDLLVEERSRSRSTVARSRWKTTMAKVRKQDKDFPPPLTSLNQNGQRNFYLKSVRRDGRLELTEVSIQRPEIFRACRQDGRLMLTAN